jgi:3-oxoacyl-[acyl-carrier-protein] synthase III
MKSFISGVAYRAGDKVPVEELFESTPEGGAALSFYSARGLKYFRRQAGSTHSMSFESIAESLRKSATAPGSIGTVLVDLDTWHASEEDRLQILEALHRAGLEDVPVIGVGLQTCSASATALDLADRLVRTDDRGRAVLVLVCARAQPGMGRVDDLRKTILSDGVAACIVAAQRGDFQILSTESRTTLATVREKTAGGNSAISLIASYDDLASLASSWCERAEVDPEAIDCLFCTNGSTVYTNIIATAALKDDARVYTDDVANFGHISSCDNLVSLATYEERNRYVRGRNYMLIGWSPYVVSGAVLRYSGKGDA